MLLDPTSRPHRHQIRVSRRCTTCPRPGTRE